MNELGKLLLVLGGILALAGLAVIALGRGNFPLGRLPGDFVYRGKNTSIYLPLGTSILISVVLSVVMYVLGKIRK